ncbi:FtsK/SpoIIIE family cell division protein, partial [gut metagenome]
PEQNPRPGLITRIKNSITQERKSQLRKVAGLIVAAFAVFTLIASLSYLFTWQSDQSLLSDSEMMDSSVQVNNSAGKLGYSWGHFLVCKCFGLGSFVLIVLLVFIAMKLYFCKSPVSLGRAGLLTISGAMILSLLLSFVAGLAGNDIAFGGGLGGNCGYAMSHWITNLIGNVMTVILIFIFSVIWLLFASDRFSRWIVAPRKVRQDVAGAEAEAEESCAGAEQKETSYCHSCSQDAHPEYETETESGTGAV